MNGKKTRKSNCFLRLGGWITIVMVLLIVTGYFWTPYSSTAMDGSAKFQSPSLSHPFGTDNMGRDILSRVMEGAGTTFFIALCVVLIGCIIGTLIGSLTGYFGGVVDHVLMRICDSITAFPSILLALVLIMLFDQGQNQGTYPIILILGILFIPSFARVVRGEFARNRSQNYIYSARLMGAGHGRILFRHILPNTIQVLLPTISIGFNNAVLAEASMSYLGVGVKPPDASLGRMLSEAQMYLGNAPWYALFTGLSIVMLILGFSLLGEGLSLLKRPQ